MEFQASPSASDLNDKFQQVQWSFGHADKLEGIQETLASRYDYKAARVQAQGVLPIMLEASMGRLEQEAQEHAINIKSIKESDNSWVIIGDLEKMAHAHQQTPLSLPLSQSPTHDFIEQLKTLKQQPTRDRS